MKKKRKGIKPVLVSTGGPENKFNHVQLGVILSCLTTIGGVQAESYTEKGKAGDPAS